MIPVLLGVAPTYDATGAVVATSRTVRDITDRKAADHLIQARNRDLETLLHVTSHDLREPLRAIGSFSRLLRERHASQLNEQGIDFLNRVIRAAGRMDGLIDDVVSLAHARRANVQAGDLDPGPLLEEIQARQEGRIRETGARLIISDDLPHIAADRAWATQALYNLVGNALKFTRPGSPPEITILPWHGNRETGLIVADRGPGVAPEHRERIFELFQRAVSREVEGSGAGLSIVRQVAERHGGRAWVQPRAGGGSEFVITFGAPPTHGAP